jgi:murein L,D-transpeptidase YafK
MKRRHLILGGAAAFSLGACTQSKFKTYRGPEVTYIIVNKEARNMYFLSGNRVIKQYEIDLGFAPVGDKFIEGDGRTPEGRYLIDRRNPNSEFHLSLGISYPNDNDRAEAAKLGKSPGGDIFIHGNSSRSKKGRNDWTWGCIAVTDREIEDIYAMVRDGTPIQINP